MYQWYPETEQWKTQYTPTLGKYDSSNRTILAAHVAMAKYAGLDALIYSWWGQGTPTDQRLPLMLAAAGAQGMKVTPYYEPASKVPAPTPAALAADFTYLYGLASDPAWLQFGGKPVLFVYNTGTEGSCAGLERLVTANAGRFYLNAKVFSNYSACPVKTDSFHQYGPATAYSQHGTYSAAVSPGFWKFNETTPRLTRDLTRFKSDLARQMASGAQWQLTTSFNEWGEGSSVEPATAWQSASGMGDYLDAMRAAYTGQTPLPTTAPSTSASPSPSSTPTVTSASPTPTVTTTPVPAGAVTIAAAGDISCPPGSAAGTHSCAQGRTADTLVAMDPLDAVLTLGDNQYDVGALTAFQSQFDPSWGRVKAKTYPAPGNHEWGTANAQGYRDYFRTGVPAAVNVDRMYYSYDVGAWHFIALDSDCSKVGGCAVGNAQNTWLRNDLAANEGKPTVAYWHHSRWTSDTRGGTTSMAPIWGVLVADRDVQVALVGHDHFYERFAPMGATGPDPAGLREFIVGTGGKNHICPSPTKHAGSEITNCTTYGVLKLTLNVDGSYGWQFVPATGTGTFTDSGTQARR